MSQQTLEPVRNALEALNERNVDRYLSHCTDDVRLESPVAAIEGAYEGPDGIRRFFGDVRDAIPDLRVEIERLDPAGPERVFARLRGRASGRVSGIALSFALANVYELVDGKIRRVRVFRDENAARSRAWRCSRTASRPSGRPASTGPDSTQNNEKALHMQGTFRAP